MDLDGNVTLAIGCEGTGDRMTDTAVAKAGIKRCQRKIADTAKATAVLQVTGAPPPSR